MTLFLYHCYVDWILATALIFELGYTSCIVRDSAERQKSGPKLVRNPVQKQSSHPSLGSARGCRQPSQPFCTSLKT